MSTFLEQDGLVATWCRINAGADSGRPACSEVSQHGDVVAFPQQSAGRQIISTGVYCQIAEQIGHVAGMSTAAITRSFGIRVPDVVWMLPEKWEGIDRDLPIPFAPDICVEVLLDRPTTGIANRVNAYLESGAREVMIIRSRGQVQCYGVEGLRKRSIFEVSLSLESIYFDA
ncbi:Uma2 family endonuclease [Paraburkholderia sp. C35]|uniref:Uma2 family endonuclease n=1 Tax=Paraburkholderia sp. C35 TaxID=2126993 RepID=UPI000D68E1CC|nr:Uma2 family endonuclease [Paraburkholderia sp. C35]